MIDWKILVECYDQVFFKSLVIILRWTCNNQIILIIMRCIFSNLFIGWELTTWLTNNCLQISVLLQIKFCPCVIETTLLCENGGTVLLAGREWFDIVSSSRERSSNDKIIIELGYCKTSSFVSVSRINNWSARHWSLTNLDILLNLAQSLLNVYILFPGRIAY